MRCIPVMALFSLLIGLAPPSDAASPFHCFDEVATIVGTPGDDHLEGTRGPDVIVAGAGRDVVHGRGGDDRICLGRGPGSPYKYGDAVTGGPGDDLINGGRGFDQVFQDRGAGDDFIRGGRGKDLLAEWRGNDVLAGGRGRDEALTAGPGTDEIRGGRGRDLVSSDRGLDDLHGGSGRDMINYEFICDRGGCHDTEMAVVVDLVKERAWSRSRQSPNAWPEDDPDADHVRGFENVRTGYGADVVRGDHRDNRITSDGPDRLHGRGGDDVINESDARVWGGRGDDRLSAGAEFIDGGPGFDLVVASLGFLTYVPIEVDLRAGYLRASGSTSVLLDIEGARGSMRRDLLLGDGGDNALFGSGGDDRLDGRAGHDELAGGRGTDICQRGEVTYTCEQR